MTTKAKCPFKDAMIGEEPETVSNPFTGQKCVLDPDAVATYDVIKGAEQIASMGMLSEERTQKMWEEVRLGLSWFKEHHPEEYMILLD
jgi:hypothetical protein|tara:strand:- start:10084 stop:10347 length:264 start_codon:yes stop_codon:yes gene_type:complete